MDKTQHRWGGITACVTAGLCAVKTGLEMAWNFGRRRLVLEVDSGVVASDITFTTSRGGHEHHTGRRDSWTSSS